MLSLELAKRLKELGLKWEPQRGDRYSELLHERLTQIYDANPVYEHRTKKAVWLPRLDQLLAEIEKRGYWWEINHALIDHGVNKYKAFVSKKHNTSIPTKLVIAYTPEEAAAKALIWILEQEA